MIISDVIQVINASQELPATMLNVQLFYVVSSETTLVEKQQIQEALIRLWSHHLRQGTETSIAGVQNGDLNPYLALSHVDLRRICCTDDVAEHAVKRGLNPIKYVSLPPSAALCGTHIWINGMLYSGKCLLNAPLLKALGVEPDPEARDVATITWEDIYMALFCARTKERYSKLQLIQDEEAYTHLGLAWNKLPDADRTYLTENMRRYLYAYGRQVLAARHPGEKPEGYDDWAVRLER
jgi:hypothetical protein